MRNVFKKSKIRWYPLELRWAIPFLFITLSKIMDKRDVNMKTIIKSETINRRGSRLTKFKWNNLNVIVDHDKRRVTVYDGSTHSVAYCATDDEFDPVVGLAVALMRHSVKYHHEWSKVKDSIMTACDTTSVTK